MAFIMLRPLYLTLPLTKPGILNEYRSKVLCHRLKMPEKSQNCHLTKETFCQFRIHASALLSCFSLNHITVTDNEGAGGSITNYCQY